MLQPLAASRSSTTPYRSDRLLLIHDPVPLGLARRPPWQHGQTSTPRDYALGLANQAGLARPVLSPQQYACALHPWLWPAAWAHGVRSCPRPVDSQTVTTPPAQPVHCMSVSCGLHHLGLSLVFGRLHLPIRCRAFFFFFCEGKTFTCHSQLCQ